MVVDSTDPHGTRQALIETAGRLFAEHGFDATSTRVIAETANVNLGAIHYHFGGKENLYLEAFRHACRHESDEAEREALWAAYETSARTDADKAALVHDFTRVQMQDFLKSETKPAWHTQLLVREISKRSSAFEILLDGIFRRSIEHWMRLFRLVKPLASPLEAKVWAFQHTAHMVFYLQLGPAVEKLVGHELDDAYIAELIRQVSRSLILQLDLPLPEDLR